MDPAWVAAIMNGGAMIILAYHFLVGLPAILVKLGEDQRLERQFWANQAQQDRFEFARRNDALGEKIEVLISTLDKHSSGGKGT